MKKETYAVYYEANKFNGQFKIKGCYEIGEIITVDDYSNKYICFDIVEYTYKTVYHFNKL